MQTTVPAMDEAQVQAHFKQAVLELLHEHPDVMREMLREIVEDIVDDAARRSWSQTHDAGGRAAPDAGTFVSEDEVRCLLRGEHLEEDEAPRRDTGV